jgi:hypothetical protein
MISRTENQKIFVQTQDENIEIELIVFFLQSFIGPSVRLQRARQKRVFTWGTLLFLNVRDNSNDIRKKR